MKKLYYVIVIFLLFLTSCISNRKLVYFPDPEFNTDVPVEITNNLQQYHLQPRDVISVRIKTLDSESADYFNIEPTNGFQQFNAVGLYINGYSIDETGCITLPEIGNTNVGGLTVQQAQKKIQNDLSDYLNNATILVKLVSFKVTVLGEVNNPGYYFIYNEQANVLEGLGLAGDLTDFGNRENITLIRQTQSGSKAILLDLKDPNLIASEYYYLQPNDVIYVQPLRAKNSRSNLNMLTLLSVLFGAVSSAVLLLTYLGNE